MNTQFTYRILTYVHSQFLEERLNVGIVFHFRDTDKFVFKYPKTFKRIKEIYKGFAESQLKFSLRAIEEKINRLNYERTSLFRLIKDETEINNEILLKDATVLHFSELKFGELYSDNQKIIEDFFNLYFSDYNTSFKKDKHDEEYIIRSFKQRLFASNESVQNLLKKDVQVKSTKTVVKFEYAWQNGVENLVKPISFDLEEESSINQKAILFHGQLNFISDEIKNRSVDLLIGSPPPTAKDSIKTAYKNALDILSEAKVKKNIVEEIALDRYVNRVITEIHSPHA